MYPSCVFSNDIFSTFGCDVNLGLSLTIFAFQSEKLKPELKSQFPFNIFEILLSDFQN